MVHVPYQYMLYRTVRTIPYRTIRTVLTYSTSSRYVQYVLRFHGGFLQCRGSRGPHGWSSPVGAWSVRRAAPRYRPRAGRAPVFMSERMQPENSDFRSSFSGCVPFSVLVTFTARGSSDDPVHRMPIPTDRMILDRTICKFRSQY